MLSSDWSIFLILFPHWSGRLSGPGGVCKVKCMEGLTSPTSSPPPGDNVLERISLEAYPLAQCNDKTAAVYYRLQWKVSY